jgi:hypothetical protein
MGERWCPRCGAKGSAEPVAVTPARERISMAVKVYTGILIVFSLVLPFLMPFIINVSLAHR